MSLNRIFPPLIFFVLLIISLGLSSCENQTALVTPIPCSPEALIQAIEDANEDPDLTEIILETGCVILFEGRYGDVGYRKTGNALPNITTPVKLIGNGSTITTYMWGLRFFWITNSGNLRLENITLKKGEGSNYFSDDRGGAIVNEGGVLSLHQVEFIDNESDYGGAIYNLGSMFIEAGTIFKRNQSSSGGGAIYNDASAGIPISISSSSFISNHSEGGPGAYGGAIYNAGTEGAGIYISDTLFKENHASYSGGAIYNTDPNSTLQITDGDFIDNSSHKDGGAIHSEAGNLILSGTNFISNFNRQRRQWGPDPCGTGAIRQKGGAISIVSGSANISKCIFDSNQAEYEGGTIYNELGSVQITDSAIRYSSTSLPGIDAGDSYTFIPSPVPDQGGPIRANEKPCEPEISFGGCISNHGSLIINKSSLADCSSLIGGGLANHENATAYLTNVVMYQNFSSIYGDHIFNNSEIEVIFSTLLNGESGQGGSFYHRDGYAQVKNSIFETNQGNNNCIIKAGTLSASGENLDNIGDCIGFSIQSDSKIKSPSGDYFITYSLPINSPALGAAIDCTDLDGNPVSSDTRSAVRYDSSENPCDVGAIEMEELTSGIEVVPGPILTAPKNLTCREGDHTDYPPLGYLLEGESAEVIGRNREGTWLVINNPDWEGICWLFRGTILLEGELDQTQIYTPPPLVLEQEPSGDGDSDDEPGLKCSGYLSAKDCEAAGGTFKILWSPPCKCP